jgi:CPA2 family monovalent cation:H+ antiporter-2
VHGTAFQLIELGAVILALSVLSRLAGRFGFSPVPLFLVAGLAFGEGGFLPLVTSQAFIQVGAQIGLVLLLLLLGLEYSAEELVHNLPRAAPIGAVNLAANFLPGVVAGLLLGFGPVGSVLLGGVTYVSSSGVVAKMISDLGWVGRPEVPLIVSVLLMEDLSMAVYLPVVSVLIGGQSGVASTVSLVVALAAVALVLFVAIRYGHRISRLVFARSDETVLLSILGLAILVAGAAEAVNVSAAVGAFLVGIALSGEAAERARDLLAPLRDLFAAVFFVFFGLQTDPADLPAVAGIALALAVVGAGTKAVTAWYGGRRSGIDRTGRLRAAAALAARGEFSVAIAGLAAESGVDERLVPLTAAYVLTLVIGSSIAARVVGGRADASAPGG